MTEPALSFFVGRTVHVREAPFQRRFQHRIAMIEVDVDRLAEASDACRWFGVDRRAAISLRTRDHGDGGNLRAWAETRFQEAGVQLDGGALRLLTFPRVMGFGFSPISLWLESGPDGHLRGVLYEVHNTFGERHTYVSAASASDERAWAEKSFFVSPFLARDGRYRFRLKPPGRDTGGTLKLTIENIRDDGRVHVATLNARRKQASSRAALSWLVSMPMSGAGVWIAIHWQALMLLVRGARYREKPPQLKSRSTTAYPVSNGVARSERTG
ncbi:MAG: DUF1365 domain-containing protein [Hyphomonadaceae bacterium]